MTTTTVQYKLTEIDDMTTAEIAEIETSELRRIFKLYKKFAEYEWGSDYVSKKMAEAKESAAKWGKEITPAEWVEWIAELRCECERCRGTGVYQWGACVNGKMSHSGQCFRCNGKGWQDNADARRCNVYDNHAISRAFREMMG